MVSHFSHMARGLLLLPALLTAAGVAAPTNDCDLILQRSDALLMATADRPSSEEQKDWMAHLGKDGRWPDIDYTDHSRGRWKPTQHLHRLVALAWAWRESKDDKLKLAIVSAYRGWIAEPFPFSDNWWHTEINAPLMLSGATVLMREALDAETLAKGAARIDVAWVNVVEQDVKRYRGENLAWRMRAMVYRCVATRDEAKLTEVAGMMSSALRISDAPENIQPDLSFQQHGHQIYNGGYGHAFAVDCAAMARLFDGTACAVVPSQINILTRYILDANRLMTRGTTYDYSVIGREIVRQKGGAKGLAGACEDLAGLGTLRQAEFTAFAEHLRRGDASTAAATGDRQFWRSDYHLLQRPEFLATVKCSSVRTYATEKVNGENLLGYHLGDGVSLFYRNGGEYRDIFPVWNWCRLPGITARDAAAPPLIADNDKGGEIKGSTEFVGGVSDGTSGASTLDLDRQGITAKKSWFFFDEGVICLGAGITAKKDGDPVTTSVNQCLLKGAVSAQRVGVLPEGEQVLKQVNWVHHDGIGYVFPAPTDVHASNQKQTGSWSRLVGPPGSASPDKVETPVFALWLDHGRKPSGEDYAYMALPGLDVSETGRAAQEFPITVLANTPALQAVRHKKSGVVAAILHDADGRLAALAKGGTLTVDQPCALLCREENNGLTLSLSDPSQKAKRLTCQLDGAFTGPGATIEGNHTRIVVELPQFRGTAGKTVEVRLTRR
jgi:chondroitin AC lyase